MHHPKKIKILFRHRSMEMGGVEKVMLSLLSNLDRQKFEMTVLLNLNQGELRDEIPPHVKKLYLADGKEDLSKNPLINKIQLLQRRRKLQNLLNDPAKINRDILREDYDVEIAMTYNDFPLVLNSGNKNSKKIGWFHSEINIPGFEKLVPDILENFPKFDHMVYCSQKIHDLMHQHHPKLNYPAESVITNAIDINDIRTKAQEKISDFPKSGPVFLSIGRLHFRKNYKKLLEVHARLIGDGFLHTILVIGDGEEKDFLEAERRRLQVENTFILAGNKMNPYPYILHADYFILPSLSEAWPLVLAEALILEKPCIATDTGDVSKIIDHGKTGLVISQDPNEMYQAMKTFLTDQDLLDSFMPNLQKAWNKFDSSKIFQRVKHLLTSIK